MIPPSTSRRPSPVVAAALLVVASIALHLGYAGWIPLSPQEAYYWQYARHLDLSYFDHPPLAAWTIRATTALLGETERGVRLAAALYALLFSLFFYLAVRRLFGERAALLATIVALLTPLFALGQTIITPDAPLLAGWAAALYFTVRALDSERPTWLLAAGAAAGLAALGKYTAWLLVPQIFLVLLLDARRRRWLAGPWPWLALALAALLFAPVLVWNARHGWVSFGFQLGWRHATLAPPSARRLASFLGLQALAVTPVLAAVLWTSAGAAARRWREPSFRVCALFSIPALAVFLAASPFMWVKGNWTAPAYPAALAAAAALYAERPARFGRLAAVSLATAAAMTLYLHLAFLVPALPFPASQDATAGWKELAARVQQEREAISGSSFVLGCTYKPASMLAWYLPGRPETFSQTAMGEAALQYDFWFRAEDIQGREGIVVLDRRDWKNCLRKHELCAPLQPLPPLEAWRGGRLVTTFELWRCKYLNPGLPAP